MNTIGIDVSKDTFHAAFDDALVRVFNNTQGGIQEFVQTLEEKSFSLNSTVIGCEATGVYHLLLCERLRTAGWNIKVINPLLTHRMIDASLRRVKTDRHDALSIRKTLQSGAGYLYTDTPEILALKTLVQERGALCRMKAETKQRLHAHKIKAEAAGLPFHDSFTGTLKLLSYEIRQIERKLGEYVPGEQKLLRSIPGIGVTTAAVLVGHIGDIRRFSSAEKFTAYIGLDCRVHQSGTSVRGKGYISKRGNNYLRHMLYCAAFIGRQKNPALKEYFERKTLKEGMHYTKALVAVERKLAHIIYAVWTRGTPFENR